MKNVKQLIMVLCLTAGLTTFAQVGIGTTAPVGAFHIDGASDNSASLTGPEQANDFVVLENGNVGVGTTEPGADLQVIGEVVRSSTDGIVRQLSTPEANYFQSGADATAGSIKNLHFTPYFSGESLLSIQANGSIGVGTNTPVGAFNVDGASDNSATPTAVEQANDFVVLENGNVGVGTTEPGADLEVVGEVVRSSTDGIVRQISTPEANYFQSGADATSGSIKDLRFSPYLIDKSLLTIQANGNIGIGTNTPTTALEVVSDNPVLSLTSTVDTNYSEIAFNNLGGTRWTVGVDGLNRVGGIPDGLHFYNSVSATVMVIEPSGNVGIGTTAPVGAFHVDGASDNSASLTGPEQANDFVVLENGNVGIGTASPQTSIDVVSDGAPILSLTSTVDTEYSEISFINNLGGTRWAVGVDGLNRVGGIPDVLHFYNSVSAAVMVIDTSGNVGIGTTSPAAKLHVDGIILIGDSAGTAVAGMIRYFGGTFEGYNGTTWVAFN